MKLTYMCFLLYGSALIAQCHDAVVLVHGNVGHPSDWSQTYNLLKSNGYVDNEIFRPDWGSKICAACNNHSGSEEIPVATAITNALQVSCTGKIDIIAHSMGVTLAAQQVQNLSVVNDIDSFVGIAGAVRGLRTCGYYPFNLYNSTCGSWGLSIGNPFLNWLDNKPFGNRVYSIKSWTDQVVCATGVCTVNWIHSSSIWGEDASYTFNYGHFGLMQDTANLQYQLISQD